ncbi:MAG: hypothetical protein R2838_10535 [Caldilineaceae bacterium]
MNLAEVGYGRQPQAKVGRVGGVEWIGEDSGALEVGRLKHDGAARINGTWGNDLREDDEGITCVRVADFSRHNFRASLEKMKQSEKYFIGF